MQPRVFPIFHCLSPLRASRLSPYIPHFISIEQPLSTAAATAFDDTFHVVAVLAIVAALLGLTLRRSHVIQESAAPEGAPAGQVRPAAIHLG